MAKKGIPAWDDVAVAADDFKPEVLFEVTVVQSVGTVYKDPEGEQSGMQVAFEIIAAHVEEGVKVEHSEYRFPDVTSDTGETITVSVHRGN